MHELRFADRGLFLPGDGEETNAPGAFLTIGELSVWAIGDELFRLESPAGTEEGEGFQKARQRARELAAV